MKKSLSGISLLKDFEAKRIGRIIITPLVAVGLLVGAIVFIIVLPQVWWCGLIFLALDAIILPINLYVIKYFNAKIKELKELEASSNTSTNDR